MSTTKDLETAVKYSISKDSVLLKIRTQSYMQRGAFIKWLSAFPQEEECLFGPLTALDVEGNACDEFTTADGKTKWTILTVVPTISS